MNIQRKSKGFTIIEVVLVLAIAGLIFLMVFIALPALQRSQRDAQRKTDLARAIVSVTSYTTNNRGSLPAGDAWDKFLTSYLKAGGDTFADPSGAEYVFKYRGTISNTFDADNPNIIVTDDATCDGENIVTGQGARKLALRMKLEGGGITCASN